MILQELLTILNDKLLEAEESRETENSEDILWKDKLKFLNGKIESINLKNHSFIQKFTDQGVIVIFVNFGVDTSQNKNPDTVIGNIVSKLPINFKDDRAKDKATTKFKPEILQMTNLEKWTNEMSNCKWLIVNQNANILADSERN